MCQLVQPVNLYNNLGIKSYHNFFFSGVGGVVGLGSPSFYAIDQSPPKIEQTREEEKTLLLSASYGCLWLVAPWKVWWPASSTSMRFNQSPARLQGGITDLKKVILKRSRLSFGSRLSLLAVLLNETGPTSVGDPPP